MLSERYFFFYSCGDETEGREREREVLRDGLIKEKLPEWENEFRETVRITILIIFSQHYLWNKIK